MYFYIGAIRHHNVKISTAAVHVAFAEQQRIDVDRASYVLDPGLAANTLLRRLLSIRVVQIGRSVAGHFTDPPIQTVLDVAFQQVSAAVLNRPI